jgi:hypothetical protein
VLAEQDAENGSAAQLVMVDDEIPHSSAPVKASAHHLSFKQLDDWGKLIRRKVEMGQMPTWRQIALLPHPPHTAERCLLVDRDSRLFNRIIGSDCPVT